MLVDRFIDSFQEKIWKDKYQYNEETYDEFCFRIASNIFPENKVKGDKLLEMLLNFESLFGGRINSNIGIDEQGLTLFNCFIESIVKNADSLEGILNMLSKYAITLKTEGGVGFCANFLRPAKTLIRKIGVTTPGSVKFLEIFDKVSEVITSGSVDKEDSFQGLPTKKSIRKGATMVTMSICHPDIEDFIGAKAVPNKLTKMNMSVLITEPFMYAVENDLDWDLWYPNINYEKYDKEWDGDFERWATKGYPYVVYKTVKAMALWDSLLKSSYLRNEPGILFIDNARRMNNLSYLNGSMLACNPCAEVMAHTGIEIYKGEELELGDVCNLGSINVVKFYDMVERKFCMPRFLEVVELMIESLDNIIEISNYPLPMYEGAAKLKRKIGLGLAGIGSLLMMMDVKYGSEESIEVIEPILHAFINKAYQTSAKLAKEKEPFPLYTDKLLGVGFVANSGVLTEETLSMIRKYGLRHSAVSAIAPNGTLSILAGNVSGGLEPVYDKEFTRWNRVEGKKVDFEYPITHKGEWFETNYLKESKVADEVILLSTDGKYRVDKNSGLCMKVTIRDYGYNEALSYGNTNLATAKELSVDEHLNMLKLFAKYIDQSCSKTINLPSDISFDEFKTLYGKINRYGVKGCTTYREGTSVAVLESSKKEKEKTVKQQQKEFLEVFKSQENGDIVFEDVKLPDEYPSRGYILKSDGNRKWYIHVAFKNKACTRPFAIFVSTNNKEDNVVTFNTLDILEAIAINKGLRAEFIEETKRKCAYQKNPVKVCRMLGLLLRHNVPIHTIVEGLDAVEEAIPGTFIFRIKKFLAQFIQDYNISGMSCPVCGEKNMRFSEGCPLCLSCGHSKCS